MDYFHCNFCHKIYYFLYKRTQTRSMTSDFIGKKLYITSQKATHDSINLDHQLNCDSFKLFSIHIKLKYRLNIISQNIVKKHKRTYKDSNYV